MTVFARLLADRRRGALGWTIGMVAGVASIVGLWPTVRGNDDMERVVNDLPTSVRALIGSQEGIPLTSAPGYLQARLFSTILPILLLVYAIGLGSRAIGGAEEDGTLQLVVTAPVTRRHIASQRFAASTVLLLGLAAVGLLTSLVLGALVGIFDDVTVGRTLVAALAVLELAILHLAIAFTFGAITGRRGPAVTAASAVAVGGYVLHGLAASAEAIRPVRVVSPWWWLLDRNLLVQDASFLSVGLPLLLAAATFVVGVLRFEQRDLRFP
ncbi:MAG: ABC transporter permease [Acidimicrobiia bacterium]